MKKRINYFKNFYADLALNLVNKLPHASSKFRIFIMSTFVFPLLFLSSYQWTHEKGRALPYGLDHHIPSKTDPNLIYTEFERYFQTIKHKITNLPKIQISHLKTKLRNTSEQCNNINVPYKEKEIINKLKKNQNIMLLRQD